MSLATRPVSTPHDEATALERLRAGDADAFAALVRDHGGRMLSVARRLLRQEDDAQDVVQEALLAAFRALPRFEGQSKLSTWLHRIVVNAALMKLRSQRRRGEAPIDDLLPHFDETGHRLDDRSEAPMPDVELDRAALRARVRRCIDHLPESYRTVLVLRDVEELDTAEVARLLETSEGAVKTRLHRARQALRTLLEREWEPASREPHLVEPPAPVGLYRREAALAL
jgi:RNA polymerase sigma-70 factor (ECF subfamily)